MHPHPTPLPEGEGDVGLTPTLSQRKRGKFFRPATPRGGQQKKPAVGGSLALAKNLPATGSGDTEARERRRDGAALLRAQATCDTLASKC